MNEEREYYVDFLIVFAGIPLIVGLCMVAVNAVANELALKQFPYYVPGIALAFPVAYHVCRKYGIAWKDELLRFGSKDVWIKALPIILILIPLNVVVDAAVDGVPITSKHLQVMDIYSSYADDLVGFISEMLFYVGEGVWLASVLYVGSRRWEYLGLIALLLYWVPNHLWCRNAGIDVLNFAFAGVLPFALEWCRRTVNNFVMVAFLFVLMVVI
jgi:hypothetical protein